MTNAFYAKGAEKILNPLAGDAGLTGVLTAVLMKNTYAQSLSADEFYDDISTHAAATPVALTGVVVTNGKLDADDPTFPAVTGGNTVEAIVLFMDTGVPATSPLIAYIDQVTSFPYATSGVDYTPQWDNGTYKIVSLV